MNQSYFEKHKTRLADFARMSQQAGARSDYVQGGGGNTSCKLDDKLMAIKASGYRLDQITQDKAYAVLDYSLLREFYGKTNPSDLEDVEKSGSAKAKEALVQIEELDVLRPSVEAGFHSMLDIFVLHSHSVYANLITCSVQGREIAEKIMSSLGMPYAYVPYINPGAQLTFEIAGARETVKSKSGVYPQIIFMENHGLIATADDVDDCLNIHEKVNQAIIEYFELNAKSWPDIKLDKINDTMFISKTAWLSDRLLKMTWTADLFAGQALYPDQLVFLAGQVKEIAAGSAKQWLDGEKADEQKCLIFRETGEVIYQCKEKEALTIDQTLTAILFIYENVEAKSYDVQVMNEAGKDFISNWESEKYRKSVAEE